MAKKSSATINWNAIYSQLAKLLYEFSEQNPREPGKILFSLCINNKEFVENNRWIEKFDSVYKVNSLDPIHVFASINNIKYSDEKRNRIIAIYKRILSPKSKYKFIAADFTGCPAPAIIHIVGARDEYVQQQIWESFLMIYKEGPKALSQKLFDRIKGWYGVELRSFTIFLFWINSSDFLSLDKNTVAFLLKEELILNTPTTYAEYYSLLKLTNTSVYRTIAKVSYDYTQLDLLTKKERQELNNYLKSITHKESTLASSMSGANNDFKIIAIKPLSGFDKKYLNILKTNRLYYFDNDYKVLNSKTVKSAVSQDVNLHQSSNIRININAIVGKNGTGKSTIAELLFLAINNLTCDTMVSNPEEDYHRVKGIKMEIYFKTITLYKIVFSDNPIVIYQYKQTAPGIYSISNRIKLEKFPLENLFYTIGVNYSLYALNNLHLGNWIYALFHKNDAYQAPIVIEPYRKGGNIDVNRQESLVKSRLLANILEMEQDGDENSFRKLTESLKAEKLKFSIDKSKTEILLTTKDNKEIKGIEEIKYGSEILSAFFEKFNLDSKIYYDDHEVLSQAQRYIVKKLIRIAIKYPHYEKYFHQNSLAFDDDFNTYLDKLLSDKSHITNKLRQTANYIKYCLFDYKKGIGVDELATLIDSVKLKKNKDSKAKLQTIELIPPSFFKTDIILSKGIAFQKLSSGEKQKIYSVNSILYHLKNLDSVSSSNNDIISYRNVNICLDEVELYFHPEMQRTYVKHLINSFNKITWDNLSAINICFITHSPFILSDIPKSQILFLNDHGVPFVPDDLNTFGANIHELLVNGFFMKNTVGDYAVQKISEIIDFHSEVINCSIPKKQLELEKKYKQNKATYYYLISNVGEDYIRKILENHIVDIENKLKDRTFYSKEIKALQERIEKLKILQNAKN